MRSTQKFVSIQTNPYRKHPGCGRWLLAVFAVAGVSTGEFMDPVGNCDNHHVGGSYGDPYGGSFGDPETAGDVPGVLKPSDPTLRNEVLQT